MKSLPAFLLLYGCLLLCSVTAGDYEEAPFHYWTRQARDPVSRLREDLQTGAIRFPTSGGSAILRAVLDYFGISPATQVLVYSKTSAQNPLISPQRPRAIYFSDNLYLGWVQAAALKSCRSIPILGRFATTWMSLEQTLRIRRSSPGRSPAWIATCARPPATFRAVWCAPSFPA